MHFDDARRIGGGRLDRIAAALALVGALAVLAANVVAVRLHSETGFFADTISNLAAGRHAWVLDSALVLFALGMGAVGLAMWRYRLDGGRFRTGAGLTVLVAAAIIVIALYEEYGDGEAGGVTIHLEVVIAMALLFTAATWLVAPGLHRVGHRWSAFSALIGLGWLVLGPGLLPARARRLGRAGRARRGDADGRLGARHGPPGVERARGDGHLGGARGDGARARDYCTMTR